MSALEQRTIDSYRHLLSIEKDEEVRGLYTRKLRKLEAFRIIDDADRALGTAIHDWIDEGIVEQELGQRVREKFAGLNLDIGPNASLLIDLRDHFNAILSNELAAPGPNHLLSEWCQRSIHNIDKALDAAKRSPDNPPAPWVETAANIDNGGHFRSKKLPHLEFFRYSPTEYYATGHDMPSGTWSLHAVDQYAPFELMPKPTH